MLSECWNFYSDVEEIFFFGFFFSVSGSAFPSRWTLFCSRECVGNLLIMCEHAQCAELLFSRFLIFPLHFPPLSFNNVLLRI